MAARYGNAETVATLIKAGSKPGNLPADLAKDNPKVKNHHIFRTLNAARYE
ncbi:MAG: hypothetical protein GDA39_09590 [Hyphomonadaceae bacterium]|nr:hypothetical protein [Hyphomonadaceae bacterium]MBC6413088.1 hypothetical protein [Hyphomonadaceae bacterium]